MTVPYTSFWIIQVARAKDVAGTDTENITLSRQQNWLISGHSAVEVGQIRP
jgi:hypothetical protein